MFFIVCTKEYQTVNNAILELGPLGVYLEDGVLIFDAKGPSGALGHVLLSEWSDPYNSNMMEVTLNRGGGGKVSESSRCSWEGGVPLVTLISEWGDPYNSMGNMFIPEAIHHHFRQALFICFVLLVGQLTTAYKACDKASVKKHKAYIKHLTQTVVYISLTISEEKIKEEKYYRITLNN